jgi:lipopolysaccharide export system permease protein
MVLLPMGIFFTYKAVNDSAVFNKDAYKNFFRKLFGSNRSRVVNMKEIAIIEVNKHELCDKVNHLENLCLNFENVYGKKPQNFVSYWTNGYDKALLNSLRDYLESYIEYAQYSKSRLVVLKLMDYPIIRNLKLYQPCNNKKLGSLMALVLPLSIPIYLIGAYMQILLIREIAAIRKSNKEIITIIENEYKEEL